MTVLDSLLGSLSLDYAGSPVVAPGETIHVEIVDALTDIALDSVVPAAPVTIGVLTDLAGPFSRVDRPPLEFSWQIYREKNGQRVQLQQNVDFVAPTAIGRILNVVVAPSVEAAPKFGEDALPFDRIVIVARVRVHPAFTGATSPVQNADEGWVVLPELALDLQPVALPTVLLSFVHTSFRPPLLISVPDNSAIRSVSQIIDTVNDLGRVATKLRSLVSFAGWLAGLDILAGVLADLPRSEVILAAHDEVADFDKIILIKRRFAFDTQVEDEIMSVAFLAPPDRSARYYVDKNFQGAECTLRTSLVPVVLIPSLVPKDPPFMPPGGVIFAPQTTSPEWENAFSSFRLDAT